MSQPQLKMTRPLTEPVTVPPLAEGYVHRLGTPEDGEALGALLSLAFGMQWDGEKARGGLLENIEVVAVHLVERDGRLVATASAHLPTWARPGEGYVHWVAADPAEGRKGLGRYVTARVMETLREHGCTSVALTTDDERLPAIVSYLREGFAPEMGHESHPDRWKTVHDALRETPAIP